MVTGGYWYPRNLLTVGSPVPSLDLPVFPHPPMRNLDTLIDDSVVDYVADSAFWSKFALPGLDEFFGILWPLVLAFSAAGIVLALLRGDALRRALAGVAAFSLAAYLLTPSTAGGPDGEPFLFVFNLRYALPGLALGAFLLMADRVVAVRREAFALALVVVTFFTVTSHAAVSPVIALVAVVGTLLSASVLPRIPRRGLAVGAGVLAAVIVVAGYAAEREYLRTRLNSQRTPRAALLSYGRRMPAGSRVAVVGHPLQFAFYGPHLDNRVDYLGEHRAKDEFTDFTDCRAWLRALARGNYDYVVLLESRTVETPRAEEFLATDAAARPLLDNEAGIIYAVEARAWRQTSAS